MPELGILPNTGLAPIPSINLDPSRYFDRAPLPAPVVDTSRLAAAQGKAALFGSIADTLAKLPDTLMSAYQAGKKMATSNKTTNAYNAALAGHPVAGMSLSDFKVTGDGSVIFNPADAAKPLTPLEEEYKRAQIDHLKRVGQKDPTLYDSIPVTDDLPTKEPAVAPIVIPSQVAAPSARTGDLLARQANTTTQLSEFDKGSIIPGLSESGLPLEQASPFRVGAVGMPVDKPVDATTILQSANSQGGGQWDNQLTDFPPLDQLDTSVLTGAQPSGGVVTAKEMMARERAGLNEKPTSQALPRNSPEYGNFNQADVDLPLMPSSQPPATVKPVTGTVVTMDPVTGIKTITTPDGAVGHIAPGGKAIVPVKPPKDAAAPIPATIRSEAIRMNVYKDGMTGEQAAKALEDAYLSKGVIPQRLLPAAESLARMVVNHPALKHYPTIREAKEAVDAGLANPDAGGFSDMALVEGFQRMVNPGATVRAQTIASMIDAAGFMQKLDPSFLWNKAVQGNKFNEAARARIKKLADDIYDRATKNAAPQLKAMGKVGQSFGISNPDDFVNNVLVMSHLVGTDGAEVPIGGTAPAGAPKPAAPVIPTAVATTRDTQMADWAKANPLDPRAATIKATQKAKGIWID